jgi:hypothetical protein
MSVIMHTHAQGINVEQSGDNNNTSSIVYNVREVMHCRKYTTHDTGQHVDQELGHFTFRTVESTHISAVTLSPAWDPTWGDSLSHSQHLTFNCKGPYQARTSRTNGACNRT